MLWQLIKRFEAMWMMNFRNDELRMQISQLQAEIQRLHQQYELNMQDKDRMSANRERVS